MASNAVPGQAAEIEDALKLFPYFDAWNKKTISECCSLSTIKIVPPEEIIFGPEENGPRSVYFIVDGTCKLIHHLLLVPERSRTGKKKYTAFREKKTSNAMNGDGEPHYSSILFNMVSGNLREEKAEAESKPLENDPDETKTVHEDGNILEVTGNGKSEGENSEAEATDDVAATAAVAVPADRENAEETGHANLKEENESSEDTTKSVGGTYDGRFSKFYRRFGPHISAKNRNGPSRPENVESHFMQIALLHKGGCLGLGENLQNRFLVSVTRVTCLVIPLQFLLQHNPNNVWNRIKQFLKQYLPSEERILSEFAINRTWHEDKFRLVSSKANGNIAKLSDVPLSVRLHDPGLNNFVPE